MTSFDFTEVASLGITRQGAGFPHLLFHGVLTRSNVESVRICFSESFEALIIDDLGYVQQIREEIWKCSSRCWPSGASAAAYR